MNRIYLRHIYDVVRDHSRCRAYLSYLKIRSKVKGHCGLFTLKIATDALQVSDVSARKHINRLLQYGYIVKESDTSYRIISHKSIAGSNSHEKYTFISDKELSSFTWRNFASFRAYLCELRIELNRRYRKYLRREVRTIDRHGVVTVKQRRPSKKEMDSLVSGGYAGLVSGISERTAFKYRKLQKVSKYEKPKIEVLVDEETGLCEDQIFTKFFYDKLSGSLLISPISKRSFGGSYKGY